MFAFANRSRGSVSIASEAERGTTVTLLLPRAVGTRAPAAPAGAAQAEAAPHGNGRSVLVVDDNEDVLKFFEGGSKARQLQPVIDSIFPLNRAADAQRKMEERKNFGKIVLSM